MSTKHYSSLSDSFFRNVIKEDNPRITPDNAIEQRLNYYYSLKQPIRKVHSNSFSGMLIWLFSLKGIGIKTGLISVCLIYILFFGNMNNNKGVSGLSDTCRINQLLVDTNYNSKDTCR